MPVPPVPDLDEVYDPETLAALDRWRPGPVPPARAQPARDEGVAAKGRSGPGGIGATGRTARLRRGSAIGAAMTALVLGTREALDPEGAHEAVVEIDPVQDRGRLRPVTFVYVPGDPRASRILLRPWLRAG